MTNTPNVLEKTVIKFFKTNHLDHNLSFGSTRKFSMSMDTMLQTTGKACYKRRGFIKAMTIGPKQRSRGTQEYKKGKQIMVVNGTLALRDMSLALFE